MSDVTMESLMEKVGSRYKIVNMASKRTLELSEGRQKLVDASAFMKLSSVALKEIQEGKISYKIKGEKKAQELRKTWVKKP